MTPSALWKHLHSAVSAGDDHPHLWFHHAYQVQTGVELRTSNDGYLWDGMARSKGHPRPYVVVQYTLAGEGRFEQGDRSWILRPGSCFIAPVPSAHRYYVPAASHPWRFLWILTGQEYAVQRLSHVYERYAPVLEMPADSVPIARLAGIFRTLAVSGYRDKLATEQAVIDFALEYECYAQNACFAARESLMEEVRELVLARISRAPGVSELAAAAGMSISHYSHHFRNTTGMAPSRYIAEIRLQEAARCLTQTRQTLKTIAAETGFADANHLCKAFRRHFHTSPGQFRQRASLAAEQRIRTHLRTLPVR